MKFSDLKPKPQNAPFLNSFTVRLLWLSLFLAASSSMVESTSAQVVESFPVGSNPVNLTFDGASIWVVSSGDATLTKLRASDGAPEGTFAATYYPLVDVAEGDNIWVAGQDGAVVKLRGSDGALLGTFQAGEGPTAMVFDGASIWIASGADDNLTKLRASDGMLEATIPVGDAPSGLAFDGANIWVTNQGTNTVGKLRASDNERLGLFRVGQNPYGVVTNGTFVWVYNLANKTVMKLRADTGKITERFTVGIRGSLSFAHDGTNVWVGDYIYGHTVSRFGASNGAFHGTVPTGVAPNAIIFDGSAIWVTNQGSATVTKITTSTSVR